jgi:putative inorganic carbon (hco3(-)) transporter
MDWVVTAIIIGIGAYFAFQRSSFLVDYVIIVFVFNRGLRRILDYNAGAFNPLSPVSLTPLAITMLMLLPFLGRFNTLPKSHKTILTCFLVAMGYGFAIGFIRVQFAAIYALAEVLAPIAMFGYILTLGADQNTKDRWLRTSAWCAIVASAYGWYQYFTIPPWDAFWVRAVGFEGYMGTLEPTKMSVFSTMAERGVFGGFLGLAIVPMIISPKWRTPLSWLGVILVLSNILLAQTRTGIILATFTILVYVMINKGTGLFQMLIAMAVIGGAAWFGMDKMPGAEKLKDRFSTLGNMQEDGSFQARMDIYSYGISTILLNPVGFGLGATGISSRINTGDESNTAVITDAGYVEIVAQYGWLGAILVVYALWAMWKQLAIRFKIGYRPTEVMLARAFIIALIPACFVGNMITQFSILWIIFGSALDPRALGVFVQKLQMLKKAEAPSVPPGVAGQPA